MNITKDLLGMKTHYRTSLYKSISLSLGVIVAIIIVLTLSGCTDTCNTTTTYTTFKPIYASMSDLRLEVKVLPPQPRETQGKIYVYGQYLLLGEPGKGIHVFDNSDKTNPVAISFINIPGNMDMAVRDGRLYADSYVDLLVFDMTDPTTITLTKQLEDVFPLYNAQFGVWIEDDKVVTGLEELEVIDVSNDCANYNSGLLFMAEDVLAVPGASSSGSENLSTTPLIGIGGSTARFTIINDYLYTVDDYMMHVFDIVAPDNPVNVNDLDIGWSIETIFPFNNNLFIGAQNGMSIYNIDNASQPVFMSMVEHINTCDPVVANENYAFVTLRSDVEANRCGTSWANELDVIDVSDVANTRLLYVYAMTSPYGLGLDGNTLFVTEGDDGLKIFDVSDVSKIDENLIQHMKGFNAYDVIPVNGTLLLIGNDGLYQFDYTNLNDIKLLSLISTTK